MTFSNADVTMLLWGMNTVFAGICYFKNDFKAAYFFLALGSSQALVDLTTAIQRISHG